MSSELLHSESSLCLPLARSLFVPLIKKSAQRTEGLRALTRAAPCEEGGVGKASPLCSLSTDKTSVSVLQSRRGPWLPRGPWVSEDWPGCGADCRLMSSMVWAAEAAPGGYELGGEAQAAAGL